MANRHFSYPQLEALWIRAGGPRRMAPVMAAIGEVESHGDSAPTPGKTGNNPATATGLPGAIGVWQEEWPLYENALPGLTSPGQLLDPLTNARLAVKLAGDDPSTMPGHPVYDNWIQWEGDISGQPAYLHYLSPGAGSGPLYALGAGTIEEVLNAGWPGGTFIDERLDAGPDAGMHVFIAEEITPAPGLHIGQHVTSRTVLGELHGGMETGWAAPPPNTGQTLAWVSGQSNYHGDPGAHPTAWGADYSKLPASPGAA